MVKLFYTTYISVYLAHHETVHAQVGEGGINLSILHTPLTGTCKAKQKYVWFRLHPEKNKVRR